MDLSTEMALQTDPSLLMEMIGFDPDPWQRTLLRSSATRVLLLCSRQLGKSTGTAFVALNEAYLNPLSQVLLVSRSERQALELFKKISRFHKALRLVDSIKELTLSIELKNGSEIIALPGDGDTIRGFSAPRLVVVDEASRVSDDVIAAVLPMLISNNGRLIGLSTPMGKRGWFYEKWIADEGGWERHNAKAIDSPRISREALEEQRRDLGERLFSQEFQNEFIEAEGQLFSDETIAAIFHHEGFDGALPPLLGI